MHHSTKRRVVLGMTTGGLLVGGLGMGIAQADTAASGAAAGSPGLLSGNLIQIPINAPINVCGNSISVVGILDTVSGNTCANSDSNGATANGGAKGSPGAGSGNLIQIPINAPINICGNSASGVGVGDTASDNSCSNGGSSNGGSGSAGSTANGGSSNSPGVGSGNTVQLPVTAPVNVCGNSVSVLGIGDTASGNTCSNGPGTPGQPTPPPCGCHPTPPVTPPPAPVAPPQHSTPPAPPKPPTTARPHQAATAGEQAKGTLAETGSGAAAFMTPLGAGMLGGSGLLLRKRVSSLHHLVGSRKG
jgi:hypothetical protein